MKCFLLAMVTLAVSQLSAEEWDGPVNDIHCFDENESPVVTRPQDPVTEPPIEEWPEVDLRNYARHGNGEIPSKRLRLAHEHALQYLFGISQGTDKALSRQLLVEMMREDVPTEGKSIAIGVEFFSPDEFATNRGLASSDIGQQIEGYFLHVRPDTGRQELADTYYSALMSCSKEELRDEYEKENGLFQEYVRVIMPIVTNPGIEVVTDTVDGQQVEHRKTPEYVENTESPEAWDTVRSEFQVIAKMDTIKGYREFYRRRRLFKESMLARSRAFALYIEEDTADGYKKFIEEFGSNIPEFSVARERKWAAEFRDALQAEAELKVCPFVGKDWNDLV